MQPRAHHTCPLCGGANQCAPAKAGAIDVECWCRNQDVVQAMYGAIDKARAGQ
jgi:hypothetical protein